MTWFGEITPENFQKRDRHDEFAELIHSHQPYKIC